MSIEKLLEIGLSGWIMVIITALFGCGIVVRQISKRRTRQANIKAGGDVAGGDIVKGKNMLPYSHVSAKKVTLSKQTNIAAKGDVAGGDIIKDDE